MRSRLAVALFLLGCRSSPRSSNAPERLQYAPPEVAADPALPALQFQPWREVSALPAAPVRELAFTKQPAPGRSDVDGKVLGYCPPQALHFALGDGRTLVTREPCSGETHISILTSGAERRVGGSRLLGVTGTWHLYRVTDDLLLMVLQTKNTQLQVVELANARATWLPLPGDLHNGRALVVQVAAGEVVVSGGAIERDVGSTGCGHPQPGDRACDPIPVTKHVPNARVMAIRLR